MTRVFEHVRLPVKCPCGAEQVHVSLADLIEQPVEIVCRSCGTRFHVDARAPAEQVGSALRPRAEAAAEHGLRICTLSLDPDA